jgi:peptide/nickel transport system substrate-binding protein
MAALAAVALLGAACSGGGSNSGPTQQTAANRGQNQINPVPYDQVKQGGTLHYALNGKIVQFNYNETDGTNSVNFNLISALMPTLFNTDAANNFTYNPDYLTGEPKLTTVGGHQTVTYEINPKAKWQGGTAISAADFTAEWKANNGKDTRYKYASTQGWSDVTDVVQGPAGPQEVVVTFDKNYGDWKRLFSPLYPASTNNDPAVFNTGWVTKPLTTAGPFMFASQDIKAQTYTLKPNPEWWGRKPKLDEIDFVVIDPDAQPAALKNNEIDFLSIGPDASKYQTVKGFPGVDIRTAGGPNFRHITINGSSAELTDVKTRQALSMGIDRNAIAKALLTPLGVTGAGLTALDNHVYMKNQDGYQSNAGTVGKFDPKAAAALLDQEGWKVPANGGTRVNDGTVAATAANKGKPLKINFVIPTVVATSASESQLIQAELKAINVEVDINAVNVNNFFDQYVIPGAFDFTVFSWRGSSFPISGSASIYASEINGQWGQNYSRVGVPEIDQLFAKAETETDPAAAIKDANAADALVWENVLSLTTYQRPDTWATKSTLINFGAFGFANVDFTAIGFKA